MSLVTVGRNPDSLQLKMNHHQKWGNMDNTGVYVSALQESLQKKLEVLKNLLQLTMEQGKILEEQKADMERFEIIIGEKDQLLHTMETLDRGFESLFAKIGNAIIDNKYQYQQQITEIQNLIRSITDTGLQIEGQEYRNKTAFQNYLTRARQEIKQFTTNNQMANAYYHNMANQHQAWQSYFVDQKK